MQSNSKEITPGAPEDFWQWADRVYRDKPVSTALLSLQDKADLSVNMLLWCCWIALQYDTAPELTIRNAISIGAKWRKNVVDMLRGTRRTMKDFESQASYEGVAALRSTVKECELQAEKIEIKLLEGFAAKHLTQATTEDPAQRARHNLITYVSLTEATTKAGFSTTLLHTLTDHIFNKDLDRDQDNEKSATCE